MIIKETDALISLDGWSLCITCGECGLAKTKLVNSLFPSARRGATIAEVFSRIKCCGSRPVKMEISCTWVLKYRSDIPRYDVTQFGA